MDMLEKALRLSVPAFILCAGNSNATTFDTSPNKQTTSATKLETTGAYQIARMVFLPDTADDLGMSGRHFKAGYYSPDEDCTGYDLTSCSAPWNCLECRTKSLQTKYKKDGCKSGYTLNEDGTDCIKTCSLPDCVNTVSSKPDNSSYTTETCEDCSGKKTINTGWTCNAGYEKSGNDCIETEKCTLPDCADTVSSKPNNSSYTTETCEDCSGTKTINTGWTCNTGYHEKNNECEKDCPTNNCANFPLTSCPEHGTCSSCTKTAQNCSTDGERYKLESCDSGYEKSGNQCVTDDCPTGVKVNGTCVNCMPNLIFDDENISEKVTYNGIDYAVMFRASAGTKWSSVKDTCQNHMYGPPSAELAKYLLTENLSIYAASTLWIRTSEACSSSGQFKGCNSATNCECKDEASTYAPGPLCVAYLCKEGSCIMNDCEGYTLDKCPSNANCSSCQKMGTDCIPQMKYKIDSCRNNYNKIGDECLDCTTTLTFVDANGATHTTKKITYNNVDYSVAAMSIGLYWDRVKEHCEAGKYTYPDREFAKYLIKNESSLGLPTLVGSPSNYVRTSEKCVIPQEGIYDGYYYGCNSATNCECKQDDTTSAVSPVCIKPICPNTTTCNEKTCSGYTLSSCPANAKCDSCTKQGTDCSNKGTVYKITDCDDGYVQEGNACVSASPSPEDSCEGVTCPVAAVCETECASYIPATACCAKVCRSCASPDADASGCRRNCIPTNRINSSDHSCNQGVSTCTQHWAIDNCGCEYSYEECHCDSGI